MPPKKKKKPKMEYQAYSDVPSSPPVANARRDPFYVVKEKVQVRTSEMKDDFEQWKDLLETSDTYNNGDFDKLLQSLKMTTKSVKIDLNDLQKTISIVESKRSRFKDISDDELDGRKKFVNDMRALVQTYEETLTSDRTLSKIKSDKRKNKRNQLFEGASSNDVNVHIDGGRVDYAKEQQLMEAKQDVVLDDMMGALDRLGDVGTTINVELANQTAAINDIDEEMNTGLGQMDQVMKKITKVLGTSNKGKLCCILFLTILAAILLMCVIYIEPSN